MAVRHTTVETKKNADRASAYVTVTRAHAVAYREGGKGFKHPPEIPKF
jgi:hypothetical protein